MNTQIKAQNLKGFRDFLPEQAILRKNIISKITSVFEQFGYDPLETPALEYAETLLGKYGEDADKLLYIFEDRGGRQVGMRYDQTVPLARIIGQYTTLQKPFKRYQIQPVWRAENTQKGRYREFLQCDADVIGDSNAPIADAEIVTLLWNIYKKIGFKDIKIVVNSRLILKKLITESTNKIISNEDFLSVVRTLDKFDKVGSSGVETELEEKQILTKGEINILFETLTNWSQFDYKKVSEIDEQLAKSLQIMVEDFKVPSENIKFNPTLARGLDYYTGIIFEAVIPGVGGSLGGGGRYDNLIKQFIGQDVSAVGFAIGFDRTIEAAIEQGLLSPEKTVTKVLVAYKDDGNKVFPTAINITSTLREAGVKTELFLDPKKDLEKQIKYAVNKGIEYIVFVGEEEIASGKYKLKNLETREQKNLSLNEILSSLI